MIQREGLIIIIWLTFRFIFNFEFNVMGSFFMKLFEIRYLCEIRAFVKFEPLWNLTITINYHWIILVCECSSNIFYYFICWAQIPQHVKVNRIHRWLTESIKFCFSIWVELLHWAELNVKVHLHAHWLVIALFKIIQHCSSTSSPRGLSSTPL